MLGKFSSAEVCCLDPTERERERGENKKVKRRNQAMGESEEENCGGVFSGIRLFLSVRLALCFSLMVMDGPPL